MKIAVTVTVCRQIGESTWKDFHTTKIFDGETKLSDIDKWMKLIDPSAGFDSALISSVSE